MALLWERKPGESAKAYAAFCLYRDLGPGRSVALAYAEWRRASGASGDAAKAAGYWQEWSSALDWVLRAEAYDGHLEALRRAAREDALCRLEERRLEFELKNQERLEARVEKAEAVLEKADRHPVTDVVQEKQEPDGKTGRIQTIRTKVKGISFSGYARLMKEINETARQAILGVRPPDGTKDGTAEDGQGQAGLGPAHHGEFAWVKPEDPDVAVNPEAPVYPDVAGEPSGGK